MKKKKKCGKCGKPGHFAKTCGLTDEERKRQRHKGKRPVSWLAGVEKKLEAAANADDDTPTPVGDDPFANLPPVNLPTEPSVSEGDAPAESPASTSGEEKTEPGKKPADKSDEPKVFMDTSQLQAMASDMVEAAVMHMGRYAAERGRVMVLGSDFAKLAGMAAAVIVKSRAAELNVSDEDGAAALLLGIAGWNGYQAYMANLDEKKAKNAQRRAAGGPGGAQQPTNGVHRPQQRPVEQPGPVSYPGLV